MNTDGEQDRDHNSFHPSRTPSPSSLDDTSPSPSPPSRNQSRGPSLESDLNNSSVSSASRRRQSSRWTTDEESEEDSLASEEDQGPTENGGRVPLLRRQLLSSADKTLNQSPTSSNRSYRSGTRNLPLRTQIRILIERALALQLEENKIPCSRGNWIRRQLDILFLRILVCTMYYYRELLLTFLLVLSVLGSFRTGPMKTRNTPDPTPFFANVSDLAYISDLYHGEYTDLVQRKIPLGPAFVFYYAPWDSESVASRRVFVSVARYFHHTLPFSIRFYAVNCWWPHGECRKNYKNLSHFPIFVAHVERQSGIIYSGPIRAELIIKFLTSILKPLTRIDNEDELWRFRAQHDAIMLSYFNFTESESVQAYETYRHMALRSFESDPFGQIGFGIFLRQDLATKYFLTSSNVISLVLFNEIHTAKWTGDKDTPVLGPKGPVGQVANWLMERTRKTPVTWAYQMRTGFANRPVTLGPVDLTAELNNGPVMLLITRRYFPSSYSPFYAALKEVALDYFNCNHSGNVTRLRRTTHKINAEWTSLFNSVSKICAAQSVSASDTCRLLRDQLRHWEHKKDSLIKVPLANYEAASERMNFSGFACSSQRPFRFFAIDPVDMSHFVELGFGGLGFHKDSDPLLFLVDAPNDMIIPFTKFNITELGGVISEYTNESQSGNLDQAFESRLWSQTHDSASEVSRTSYCEDPKTSSSDVSYSMVRELVQGRSITGEDDEMSRRDLVRRMNSEDLQTFLARKPPFHYPSPLFLMYTAKFCGTCGVALSSFVELSRFMKDNYSATINITFGKIDMVANSLPTTLTPEKLPTFVLFPAQEREDVRVFPAEEPVTSKTLLHFLLGELDPETRLRLSLESPRCHNELRKENSIGGRNSTGNSCISTNKATVAEKLETLFKEIQGGMYSTLFQSSEMEQELGLSLDALKTRDLDHLRSMKITLEVA